MLITFGNHLRDIFLEDVSFSYVTPFSLPLPILYNNPMTTEQSVLLKLIRQSQFDTIEDIAWDDIDLDALYEEASQQAVLGLIAPLIPEAYSNDTWRRARLRQEAS